MRNVENCDGAQCPLYLVDGKPACNALGCKRVGVNTYNQRNGLLSAQEILDLEAQFGATLGGSVKSR